VSELALKSASQQLPVLANANGDLRSSLPA
jgi:hypothetical protein